MARGPGKLTKDLVLFYQLLLFIQCIRSVINALYHRRYINTYLCIHYFHSFGSLEFIISSTSCSRRRKGYFNFKKSTFGFAVCTLYITIIPFNFHLQILYQVQLLNQPSNQWMFIKCCVFYQTQIHQNPMMGFGPESEIC